MANWKVFFTGKCDVETDDGYEVLSTKAEVLIEDGKPVRVSVNQANYAGNEVEKAFVEAYPGKRIEWVGIPSGENELVGLVR